MAWLEGLVQNMQTANWWDLVPATVGAIIGAAAASVPAFLLARKASRETLARDRISRLEQQKAATFRALTKLQIIINDIKNIHQSIEDMISKADSQGHQSIPLWQKIVPTVGINDETVRFEAEEIIVFVLSKDFDYLNDLLLLNDRHAALKAGFKEYARHRLKVTEQLPATIKGNVLTTLLTSAQLSKFAPRFLELESLVTEMREFAARDWNSAQKIAEQFGPKVRDQLADPNFPKLSVTGKK